MKTLDRYITRIFLMDFVILVTVIMSLFVLIDVIVDIDEFTQAADIRTPIFGNWFLALMYSVFDFYYPQILLLYVFFSGVLVVGAMGFTFSALARNRETLAMVTGGLSMYRIAAPVIVVGTLLNAAAVPLQEFLIPPLANKLARGKAQVRLDTVETFAVQYARDGQGNLFSAGMFDPLTSTMEDLTILQRDELGRIQRRITARHAVWDNGDGPLGWRLEEGQFLAYETDAQGLSTSAARSAQPIDFFPTDLKPQILLTRRATIYPRLLSMRELLAMAANRSADTDTIRRLTHGRFSMVVVSVLILVMALPFFLNREPVNLMVQALKAIVLCMSAWAAGLLVMQVGVGLNPVFSAWLPVALLLPLVAWMVSGLKT